MTTKKRLKDLLATKMNKDMLHKLITCWDDGSLDQILEDLLPIDAERFPETYNTQEDQWTQASQSTRPKSAKHRRKSSASLKE